MSRASYIGNNVAALMALSSVGMAVAHVGQRAAR